MTQDPSINKTMLITMQYTLSRTSSLRRKAFHNAAGMFLMGIIPAQV